MCIRYLILYYKYVVFIKCNKIKGKIIIVYVYILYNGILCVVMINF